MVQNASMSSVPRGHGWLLSHPMMGVYWSPPGSNATQAWRNASVWDLAEGGSWGSALIHSVAHHEKWIKSMKSVGWRARRFLLTEVSRHG